MKLTQRQGETVGHLKFDCGRGANAECERVHDAHGDIHVEGYLATAKLNDCQAWFVRTYVESHAFVLIAQGQTPNVAKLFEAALLHLAGVGMFDEFE